MPPAFPASLRHLREGYDALAPEAHARFILSLILLVISLAGSARMAHWIIDSLAMKVLWTRTEAVIIGAPRLGPPEQKRGHAHWVRLQVDLPDGGRVTAEAMRPIFDRILPADGASAPVRRLSPQAGDRIAVYVNPRTPDQIMPATELNIAGPGNMLGVCLVVIGLVLLDMRSALRKARLERSV